jgi:hypothetical protein
MAHGPSAYATIENVRGVDAVWDSTLESEVAHFRSCVVPQQDR